MIFIKGRNVAIGAIGLAILSLTGCKEEIDARQTQQVQGLLYKVRADDPFTGRVTNYPMSVLGILNVGSCTIDFKKGLADGDMKCSDNAGKLVGTGEFKAGLQDGKAERFDPTTGKKTVIEHWKSGRKSGVQEKFNAQTGERVLEVSYSEGRQDGRERAWDSTGKEKIVDLEWKNGLQSGFDNRSGQHRNYVNGKKHGLQKDFSIDGNRIYVASESNYDNDLMDGVQKRMDARGNVTELSFFEDGEIRSRTVDEYNSTGQQVHHYTGVAILKGASQYIASDLSKDGIEKYWSDQGHLIRELHWNKGVLQRAVATVWAGGKEESHFQGVGVSTSLPTQDVVKHGQERVFNDNGELQIVIFWNAGKPAQILAALAPSLSAQYPTKMAQLSNYQEYGSGVTSVPEFERASRFSIQGIRGGDLQLVDIPAPNQALVAEQKPVASQSIDEVPSPSVDSDNCLQQKIDAVHAENPNALIRADMLDEFEQDCK